MIPRTRAAGIHNGDRTASNPAAIASKPATTPPPTAPITSRQTRDNASNPSATNRPKTRGMIVTGHSLMITTPIAAAMMILREMLRRLFMPTEHTRREKVALECPGLPASPYISPRV